MVRKQNATKPSAGKLHKAAAGKWLDTVRPFFKERLNCVIFLCRIPGGLGFEKTGGFYALEFEEYAWNGRGTVFLLFCFESGTMIVLPASVEW